MQFLAFWAFISFHFGLLGIHFLSFWSFGHSFPFILAFWPFGPSFPFILAFWAFISFHFGLLGFISFHFGLLGLLSFHFGLLGLHFLLPSSGCPWGPPHKLPKTVRFAFVPYKEFSRARPGFIFQILAFWASIPHFGLLGLDFLPFWPFGPYFLSFWPFGPSFPFILPFWAFILAFSAFISFHFGLLGLHLPFWAFISFHFGLLGLHFLSFWPFGPSFPFIVACLGCCVRSPPQVVKNGSFS